MTPHSRDTLARATLVVASLVFTALLVEIVLRLVYPIGAVVYRFDDRYFQGYRPNARKIFRRPPINGGDRIRIDINSYGFRGREFVIARPETRTRVVVYGDSYVAAEFSELAHSFPAQLEARLASGLQADVEVLNAGIVGFGPDQVARRLPDDLRALRPDLVVVAVSAHNDFGDLIRNRLYRLGHDGTLFENAYRVSDALRQEFQQTALSRLALAGLWRAGWRGISQRISTAEPTEPGPEASLPRLDRELQAVQAEFERFVVQGDQNVETVFVDRYDADVSLLPESPSAVYKTALMRATIGRIRELTQAAGSSLLVVVIPSPFVFDGYDGIHADAQRFPGYAPEVASSAVATAADACGVPAVDLFSTFVVSDPHGLYFTQDTHWNDRGQALAADVVAARILSERLLR